MPVKNVVKQKVKASSTTKKSYKKNGSKINGVAETEVEYLIIPKPKLIEINSEKICRCEGNKINCLTAKEWLKNQLGVWEFFYEKRDIRDKNVHPATFPISMARKVIELFTHEGELVLDPFVGSGTTLVAAQDTNRNAIGFDLQKKYVDLCNTRLSNAQLFNNSKQIAVVDDARNISHHVKPKSVKLIWTSPPYANLLNRKRKNKSRSDRDNNGIKSNNESDKIEIQICNHCGRDVSLGSGLFVNRIPDFNDIETRIDNNLEFPLGDFVCWECDQKSENNYE